MGRVCISPGWPLPCFLAWCLEQGRAVDGRSMCQGRRGGASSMHALASRVWVAGVRGGGGGEGP